MVQGVREFLDSKAGKVVSVGLLVVALGAIAVSVKANFGQSDAAAISTDRTFIDATTGKPFKHSLSPGEKIPVKAPSGGNTGYSAESCYWTKDGQKKDDPTWVLLNETIGKRGPTFCPDCGRLVVGHNPGALPGIKPPPTQEEYSKHPSIEDR